MSQVAGFRGLLADPSNLAFDPARRDPGRAVYRYHQTFPGPGRSLTRKNLVLAVGLSPWDDGAIRPHEDTVAADRDAALAAIRERRRHDAAVVLGVRDPAGEIERLLRKHEAGAPTLEHTSADGTLHRLWRIQDAELIGKLRHYFAPKKLHVLDGHARYEAMLAYRDELARDQALATYASPNYALACVVSLDDPGLVSAPRHRVVRGATVDRDAALAALRGQFIVDKLDGASRDVRALHAALADTVAHQPAAIAVFAGDPAAWKLTLSPDVSPFAEGAAPHHALHKLEPVVVDRLLVPRAFPGATLATELDAARALAALDSGATAALIMRPLSIEQIVHVDELGQRLPAGSTALHPAIAPLVAMRIDPDEDLV